MTVCVRNQLPRNGEPVARCAGLVECPETGTHLSLDALVSRCQEIGNAVETKARSVKRWVARTMRAADVMMKMMNAAERSTMRSMNARDLCMMTFACRMETAVMR